MTKPYVIGIAGGTCSGKSTLCDILKERLGNYHIKVFHMDNYYKEDLPTTIAPITQKEYSEFNHPEALKLTELFADFNQALLDDTLDYVIIEGLFALYLAEIRNQLDFKVFVDLKSDERVVRRIQRNLKFGHPFDDIVNRFLDTVRFRHDELVEPTRWHADVALNGTLDIHNGVEVLLTYITTQNKTR